MITFNDIRKSGDLLFESIRGSHLYGLNTETSDTDTFGVFCGPADWFLGNGLERLSMVKSEKNDDYWDELDKYFFELGKSNPEALISLFTPEKYILHYNTVLDPLWNIRDKLLTKACFKSFSNYALSQIKKAKGLNKAINTDPEQVKVRKNPLYFCQVPVGIGTWTLEKWLRENNLKQEHCGISRLPGTIECFALFYDWGADKDLKVEDYARLRYKGKAKKVIEDLSEELKELQSSDFIAYRGILSPSDPLSSQLRVSSIPKGIDPICYFQFNSNAYSSHCVDYKRYWDWVKNRNPERFKLNEGHNWDGKNICHCVRLMTMAKEIAEGKGLILDRSNIDRDWLLKIKTHQVGTYEEIMAYVEKLQSGMEESFVKSKLPDSPDLDELNKILIKIRQTHYARSKKS